jgi:hypothetical protein
MRFGVSDFWQGRPVGPVVLQWDGAQVAPVEFGAAAVAECKVRLPGSVMPGLVDRHVHLGLVDAAALAGTSVVEVTDLGWIPEIARGWQRHPPTGGVVRIAGAFHTAPGGYPTGRSWAPPESVWPLTGPDDAVRAARTAASNGHDLVKLVLQAPGPMLSDDTLTALVTTAHAHQLPVGVHAEGPGQARRAFEAGADLLVHTPWTEALPEDLVLAMAASMTWVSTLAIHSGLARHRALANARQFVADGGRLVYGTDWGNGPAPIGPRPEEIRGLGAAGLSGDALLHALTGAPTGLTLDSAVYAARPLPATARQAAGWLTRARRLRAVLDQEDR